MPCVIDEIGTPGNGYTTMAWIKFDKDLIDDPRILRAAERMAERGYVVAVETFRGLHGSAGNDLEPRDLIAFLRNAVTGSLCALWVYADTHIRNGDVLPIGVTAIDRMVGIDGFCELLGEDWIKPSADGESVVLPGYCEKNGLAAKERRRTENAERQRRFREKRNAPGNAVSNAKVTTTDLDRDLDHKNQGGDKSPSKANGLGRYWETQEATLAAAKSLGLNTRGESWEALKSAVRDAAAKGPREKTTA